MHHWVFNVQTMSVASRSRRRRLWFVAFTFCNPNRLFGRMLGLAFVAWRLKTVRVGGSPRGGDRMSGCRVSQFLHPPRPSGPPEPADSSGRVGPLPSHQEPAYNHLTHRTGRAGGTRGPTIRRSPRVVSTAHPSLRRARRYDLTSLATETQNEIDLTSRPRTHTVRCCLCRAGRRGEPLCLTSARQWVRRHPSPPRAQDPGLPQPVLTLSSPTPEPGGRRSRRGQGSSQRVEGRVSPRTRDGAHQPSPASVAESPNASQELSQDLVGFPDFHERRHLGLRLQIPASPCSPWARYRPRGGRKHYVPCRRAPFFSHHHVGIARFSSASASASVVMFVLRRCESLPHRRVEVRLSSMTFPLLASGW